MNLNFKGGHRGLRSQAATSNFYIFLFFFFFFVRLFLLNFNIVRDITFHKLWENGGVVI